MRCKTDVWPVAPHARCHTRAKEQAAEPLFDGGAARPIHPSFHPSGPFPLSLSARPPAESTSGKSCVRASIVGVLTEVRSLDCDAEVRQSAPLRTRRRRTKAQVCKSNTARIMRAKGVKAALSFSPGGWNIYGRVPRQLRNCQLWRQNGKLWRRRNYFNAHQWQVFLRGKRGKSMRNGVSPLCNGFFMVRGELFAAGVSV